MNVRYALAREITNNRDYSTRVTLKKLVYGFFRNWGDSGNVLERVFHILFLLHPTTAYREAFVDDKIMGKIFAICKTSHVHTSTCLLFIRESYNHRHITRIVQLY